MEVEKRSEIVMLFKYGKVYPGSNSLYCPYSEDASDWYSRIAVCVDWLYRNKIQDIRDTLDEWIKVRVAKTIAEVSPEEVFGSLVENTLAMSRDEICQALLSEISRDRDEITSCSDAVFSEWVKKDEVKLFKKIAEFINEKFLKVSEGGKYYSEGEDAIYFRISSHGYDWHRSIVEYLWDAYGDVKRMPRRVWIGHDFEDDAKALFDGTSEELFKNDDQKVYEDLKVMTRSGTNAKDRDRESVILNRLYISRYLGKYVPFK